MAFQRWLKLLNERGILLAVCSKNEPAAAKLPFEKHPDMVLKLEDFSAFVANWENKAGNISNIQKTLNIGMDSIVFIDDNPFERNAVRELLPDCIVPEMPEDVAMFVPVSYTHLDVYKRQLCHKLWHPYRSRAHCSRRCEPYAPLRWGCYA